MKLILFGLVTITSVNSVHTSDSKWMISNDNSNQSRLSHKRDCVSIAQPIDRDANKRCKTFDQRDDTGKPSYRCSACGQEGHISDHMHSY